MRWPCCPPTFGSSMVYFAPLSVVSFLARSVECGWPGLCRRSESEGEGCNRPAMFTGNRASNGVREAAADPRQFSSCDTLMHLGVLGLRHLSLCDCSEF